MKSLLLAAVLLLIRPAPTDACSCGRPAVEVTPAAGAVAPTNARVRVSWDKSLAAQVDPQTIQLRPKDGANVEADRRTFSAGEVTLVELVPRAPLAAKTKFEVVLAAPGGKESVVGEFVTSEVADTKAPLWTGVTKAAYVEAKAVCCDCSTGKPYAVLSLGKPTDDDTPPERLRYAVWLPAADVKADAKADAKVDTTQPPLLLARAWGDELYLGNASQCTAANFTFPAKKTKAFRLVVAPVDTAGNVGAPSEVTLDLTRPLKKRP